MHVLVTRPEDDAREMTARIEALGCRVSVAPLIEIVHEVIAPNALDGAVGLIATSRNAIAALSASAELPTAITLPIFTVSGATAARAADAGFATVIAGPGTAAELAPIIAKHSIANPGPLFHLAGDHLAVDLAGLLAKTGVNITPLLAYRSVAAETLAPGVSADLRDGAIDAVILMSPRTARIWRSLTSDVDVTRITHVCLSETVAKALIKDGPPRDIAVAAAPTSEAMLAVIQHLASRFGAR